MFGVAYKGQLIEYHNFDARPLDGEKTRRKDMPNDLHALDFSLGMVWVSAQKKWVTTVQFRPGIHSDFEDIDGGDFIYTGTLLVQRVFGEKNQNMWGLGATYTDLLGKQMVIPLVRLFWYPTEHWFVELTVPVELDVGYRFSRSFSVGIEQKLQGYLYRLTEDDPWNEAVLRYREVQIGPFLDWQFGWKNKMHFRVSGGVSTFQNFEFRDRDNDKKLRDGDMKTAPYGTANFYITF